MSAPIDLPARIRQTALQRGPFHLPTGQVIENYFDEFLLAADPTLLQDTAAQMATYIPPGTDVLVGLELGGVPLAVAMSTVTGTPVGFIRRQRKTYGTCRQLEGNPVAGRRVVLVDDVVRSGSQILRAAAVLRHAGAHITTAVCVLDRGLEGRARLAQDRIDLRSVLTGAAFGSPASVPQPR